MCWCWRSSCPPPAWYHPESARGTTSLSGAASIRVAILRCSVARDAQRTGSTPRIPGSLAPRLARDLPQHQTDALPGLREIRHDDAGGHEQEAADEPRRDRLAEKR